MIFITKGDHMKGTFEKKRAFKVIAFSTDDFQSFPPMFHPHCELIYVRNGGIRTVIDGEEHTARSGECILLFPFLTHSYESEPCTSASVILFAPEITAYEGTLKKELPASPFVTIPEILPLIERAIYLYKMKDPASEKTATGYLDAIIGEVLAKMELSESDEQSRDTSAAVLEYCSEHYKENVNISSVAAALYISPSYVSKLFAVKLKYKFREYINILRINEAKRMLVEGDMKIVDIMLECGFSNQSSFNRIFAQACGVTPYQYRKDNKST